MEFSDRLPEFQTKAAQVELAEGSTNCHRRPSTFLSPERPTGWCIVVVIFSDDSSNGASCAMFY